jgi:hypothetical protein
LIWWFTAPTAIQRLCARGVEVACEGAYQYEQNGDAIIFQPPHAPKETWNNVGLVWFVRESRVENADLSLLQTLPKLKVLGLQSPSLDDRCLDQVLAAPHVKFVAIGGSGISDAGLLRLASLPKLEILDASGTHAVSGDAIVEFKHLRPRVKIIRKWH